jgi:hypothetical protein
VRARSSRAWHACRPALALSLAIAALPAGAEAQGDARAEARREFEAGIAAARTGDWPAAHDRFAHAYELAAIPGVLMNLAGAQRHTGRLLESAASYRRWLGEVTSGRDARHRESVTRALAEVEAATPHVTIRATGAAARDVVQLDGATVTTDEPIAVNPGAHVVAVLRGATVVVDRSIAVAEGASETVTLEVPAQVVPTPREVAASETAREERDEAPPEAPPPSSGGDDAGWIVLGVLIGAAAVAGVVVPVVIVTTGSPSPYQGNFGPGTVPIP